ncbi:MAG: hypothetical protein ACRENU_16415 [Gemmatimonadaceae bacterium]
MPLKVMITKRADGSGLLKCIRADGTETWQKQTTRHASHFALHDLTHFAVESELGVRDAFYGLIADGWSIEDTTGKGERGALPPEALFVENLVGTFDMERASGSRWTAEEFNDATTRHAAAGGRPVPRKLTDGEIARIRKRRAELFAQWHALPNGQVLTLSFP